MSLISCPSCRKKIDENANPCPNCGRPEPYIGYLDNLIKQKEESETYLREREMKDKFYEKVNEEISNNRRQKDKEEWEKRRNERRIENSKNLKRGLIAGVLVMIYYFFRNYLMNP